jgi:hypothetical protein
MSDKINNWYTKLPQELKREPKLDKNFHKHHVLPNSMICCIGGTGSGKTNALMEMISRMEGKFYEIIIFNPVSTDEPIYSLLKKMCPDIQLINDINELPSLSEFDDADKSQEKLIVFDDFINMNKKDFKKINEYLTGGRKSGFTVYVQSQNYTSIPKIITRNCQYFILFRLNDNISINNIIRNHNIDNIDADKFKNHYIKATENPRDFFLVDLKTSDKAKRLRHNFLNLLQ